MPIDTPNTHTPLPPTARKLILFQLFNAINFTIVLGAPLVLTARYLGATEFQVGLINALGPGLVALQILTVGFVDRIGYREVMLLGWSLRSFMLLLIVPLPLLLGRVDGQTLVWLLALVIFLFNMIRGLTAGAWLPWLKHTLPEARRGYFFGLEQLIISLSAFTTLVLCGWFLGEDPTGWRYSTLFVVAWIGGLASVVCLRQTPPTERIAGEVPKGESPLAIFRSAGAIWRHAPFRRIAIFIAVHALALSALPVFLILFLREELGIAAGTVLKLQSAMTVGTMVTAMMWGPLADRVGSRPIMRIALGGQLALTVFWLLCAFAVLRPPVLLIGAVNLLWGGFMAAQGITQLRLVLDAAVPEKITLSMGHFQVATALCSAAAPLLLGTLLTGARRFFSDGSSVVSLPFALLFGYCLLMGLLAHVALGKVRESKALRTRELLVQVATDWPVRVLQVVRLSARRFR